VDDAGFARMKAGSLLRRGYGARRIAQALGQDGIEEAIREEVAPDDDAARGAALSWARKKGLGPFTRRGRDDEGRLDPALREKQVATMLRAGHSMAAARAVVGAGDVESLEVWASEGE
jgi:regulatory protein